MGRHGQNKFDVHVCTAQVKLEKNKMEIKALRSEMKYPAKVS